MLDKSKDFGTLFGEGNAKFYQEGKYYNASGDEVTEAGELVFREPAAPPEDLIDTEVNEDVVADVIEPNTNEMDNIEEELEAMAWQAVKKRVEAAGGVWTNKIEGIKYLRGM